MKKGFTLKGKRLNLAILVVGIIMISIVGTKAATTIQSSMVSYNNTTVKETLDDLVDITIQGDATSNDIATGKTAVVQGELITGTMEEQEKVVRWFINTQASGYLNIKNPGKIKIKTVFRSGSLYNLINVYGTNDATAHSHTLSNLKLITSYTVLDSPYTETILETGTEYDYLLLHGVYGTGGTALVEVSY